MIHERGEDFAPEAGEGGQTTSVAVARTAADAIDQLWGSLFLSPERSAPKSSKKSFLRMWKEGIE